MLLNLQLPLDNYRSVRLRNEIAMASDQPPQLNFGSRKRKLIERYAFSKMVQEKGESFTDFVTKIQTQGKKCKFGDTHDELLMDKIIAGIENDTVREELLSVDDLTLESAMRICREMELAFDHLQEKDVSDNNSAAAKAKPNSCSAPNEIINSIENNAESLAIDFLSVFSELECINEDCLIHVCKFLDLMDVVNLAATCVRTHVRTIALFCRDRHFSKKSETNHYKKVL